MQYLAIIRKTFRYHGALFERGRNHHLFETMEQAAAGLPLITTTEGLAELPLGTTFKVSADNISDIEGILRYVGFRRCDVCGDWISPDDIRDGRSTWDGEKRRCQLCEAKKESPKRLELAGYHDTNDDVRVINGEGENFDLSNVLGVGIEFEYYNPDASESEIKCTNDFYEIAKEDSPNRMFRCERDGTVTGEIISNVFTKKALYAFDWKKITDVLVLNGNVDGNHEAGLHVHLSKLWLGTDEKEQCLNFLKLQYFMKSYEEDFLKLCGRARDCMYWCQFFSYEEIERMKNDILNEDDPWDWMPCQHGHGVGCALNSSGATIEYRIGANTNDPERVKHYLRFILGIVENIKNVPFSKCYCIGKVTRLVPADTMAYWRKHGCFLKTNANDSRGESI